MCKNFRHSALLRRLDGLALLRPFLILICVWAALGVRADDPVEAATHNPAPVDFSFTDRDGEERTFFAVLDSLQPGAEVYLLLFDPDCDECHGKIAKMQADPELNAALEKGTAAVVAVFPVDEPLEPDDPNLPLYRRACETLPASWVVGIDNGSIFDSDAYIWDTLPLLLHFTK